MVRLSFEGTYKSACEILTLFLQFSQVTSNIIEAIVSVKRLKDFLDAEELQTNSRVIMPSPPRGSTVGTDVGCYPIQ